MVTWGQGLLWPSSRRVDEQVESTSRRLGLGAETLRLCPQLSDTWPLTYVFCRVTHTLSFIQKALKELVVIIPLPLCDTEAIKVQCTQFLQILHPTWFSQPPSKGYKAGLASAPLFWGGSWGLRGHVTCPGSHCYRWQLIFTARYSNLLPSTVIFVHWFLS